MPLIVDLPQNFRGKSNIFLMPQNLSAAIKSAHSHSVDILSDQISPFHRVANSLSPELHRHSNIFKASNSRTYSFGEGLSSETDVRVFVPVSLSEATILHIDSMRTEIRFIPYSTLTETDITNEVDRCDSLHTELSHRKERAG